MDAPKKVLVMVNFDNNDVLFYFDESGFMGSENKEPDKKEISLICGIAFPKRNLPELEDVINNIFSGLDFTNVKKKHWSELSRIKENHKIKDNLFNFLTSNNKIAQEILIIYDAYHSYGYYTFCKEENDKLLNKSNLNTSKDHIISLDKPNKPDKVYISLLTGVIFKLDDVCEIEGNQNLLMISDPVDKSIKKDYRSILSYIKTNTHKIKRKYFDRDKKQEFSNNIISSYSSDFTIKNIDNISFEEKENNLVLTADIICNSIYNHLKDNLSMRKMYGLNSKMIMDKFKLINKIPFLGDKNKLSKSDSLYNMMD